MRLLTVGLLAGSVILSGCDRAGAPANNAQTTMADTDPNAATAPITTSGADAAGREADWREITIPAGTTLPVVLDTPVASDTSRVEDPVQAHIAEAITVDGATALPQGSIVTGVVTDAVRPGKVEGRGRIALRFDTIDPSGVSHGDERYTIETSTVGRTAPATKKEDALKIGAPAAGGAIIGGLIGGKKGALIGTAAGGGAGTAVVLSTRGQEARLGKGAALTLRLAEPLTVTVRTRG